MQIGSRTAGVGSRQALFLLMLQIQVDSLGCHRILIRIHTDKEKNHRRLRLNFSEIGH